MEGLPDLVLQQIFQQVIDFRSLEYFEDPDFLGTWGLWADMILPLLHVCREWRRLSLPSYYQFAAYSYFDLSNYKVRALWKKARLREIRDPALVRMVKHVYMHVYIRELLCDGLAGTLSALGDQVFAGVTQLVIVVESREYIFDDRIEPATARETNTPPRPIDSALTREAVQQINWASYRLHEMFPNIRAVDVSSTSRTSAPLSVAKLCCELMQNKVALSVAPTACIEVVAPMVHTPELQWIRVDLMDRCRQALELVRRNAATLQTLIFTNARAHCVGAILHDADGEPLVYGQLRVLRLGLLEPQLPCAELAAFTAFPQLKRVACTPCDPHIAPAVLRPGMERLTSLRMFLSGASVRRLCSDGVLDACELPALRHIELLRPADSSGADNGAGSMGERDLLQLALWALRVGHHCLSIVLSSWRIRLPWLQYAPPLLEALAHVHGTLRSLELPLACSVSQALAMAARFPHLSRFGVPLTLAQNKPCTGYELRNLRELCVAVSGAREEHDVALACELAAQVTQAQRLVYHVEHEGVPDQAHELHVGDVIAAELESERFGQHAHLAQLDVQSRGPDPRWL
ncbi:hypothetical protein IWW51_004620 [Coemansia sp. RSA 2702]|nr:hypothetical protein IWW54_004743 [Coemansia sp. RSA 2705]KAJ2319205.1 hypothetical protein IWW52_002112 [Coemansia sp. RSA 2704]KAJ2320476.1 hypothetical protein IWW51_004620 [Coemansia sp. RSA 2702]KAJ2366486.1 hypothetical protein H4S01_002682 [Coemansia sp. RSA 2610]KAJ2735761.1 hypothetical protein H4R23_002145 [Coemansia sp. Cherry 401B]